MDSLEEKDQPEATVELTPIAKELKRLTNATTSAASKRERLPQPLFWSLFHLQISRVRKLKASKRNVEKLLLGVEE